MKNLVAIAVRKRTIVHATKIHLTDHQIYKNTKRNIMKYTIRLYAFAVFSLFCSSLQAMDCAQFNHLGNKANNLDQVVASNATTEQLNNFKKVIANHAAEIDGSGGVSNRKKALKLILNKNMLGDYVGGSLATTRVECFMRPREPMRAVAIEQFDFMLDALAKKL